MTQKLSGKVALVTGAGGGIGSAIARLFASEGAFVACCDLSERRAKLTAENITATGGTARGYFNNVADRIQTHSLCEEVAQDAGSGIDILVNNAAWIRYQPLAEIDEETLARMIGVGTSGVIWASQAAGAQMAAKAAGAIVNICSTAAIRATEHSVAYCAVKGAVAGLTRACAVDLGRVGVRVNAVAPAFVPTEAALAKFDDSALQRRLDSTPLGRFATPEDIAAVALFLASDDGRFVNGEVIVADGGRANSAL